MSGADEEMIKEFLWCAKEDIGALETQVVQLEQGEPGVDDIDGIYRGFHSLKGAAGLVMLPKLEEVAHACEALLSHYRGDPSILDSDGVQLILNGLDLVKDIVGHLEQSSQEGEVPVGEFLKNLHQLEQRLAAGVDKAQGGSGENSATSVYNANAASAISSAVEESVPEDKVGSQEEATLSEESSQPEAPVEASSVEPAPVAESAPEPVAAEPVPPPAPPAPAPVASEPSPAPIPEPKP